MSVQREQWGSRIGFVLAAAGGAIGLGNIWKFPYVAGQNGGAAFILIYLAASLLIAFPILIGEIFIGRKGQRNPVGSFRIVGQNRSIWTSFGYLGVLTGFIILSYYNVVAGWSLGYIIEALRGVFSGFEDPLMAGFHYELLMANPKWIIGWQAIFAAISVTVVYAGVQNGIEKYSKILMPLFLMILLFLVVWGIILDSEGKGLAFLFKPDWSVVKGKTILEALGQAFFSLSLGMGAMLTYGSYLKSDDNILSSALMVAILDVLIAILAGIAIFTAVFAMGLSPDSGPGLVFKVLPAVFAKLPGGTLFGVLFFLLLTIAAVTSAISLLEVISSYFVDEKNYTRHKVVVIVGIITFFLGIPSALSFGYWKNVTFFGLNFFGMLDYVSANIMLPLGGLAIAILLGWQLKKNDVITELRKGAENIVDASPWSLLSSKVYLSQRFNNGLIWHWIIRYVAPVVILLVFLYSLGLI
ncbi:MAG TPA: sodium-dependent transporter [Candidatus Marinimicrobia bacterium]|nr:sodium-dependent transporter [Candidatus Neomarinimicrobiota bacterium]